MHHRAESQPFTSCNPNSPTYPLSPSHRHVKSHIFSIPVPLFAKNDNEKINTSEFEPLQSPSSDRHILISPDRIANDMDLHKSIPIEEGSPEIMDTIPTNRGTENKLSQKGEEPENLYTEDNFLITPFTYDLAEKLTRRKKEKQNEIEVKMSGSRWFGCKDWILRKIFRQKGRMEARKIAPEIIGTVNNAAGLKLTEMKSQRAKRNWAKAKYLYHMAKVAEALSLAMNEKEQRIERGKTMRDMKEKEDLDRWKALMRYWYISPHSKFCIFWRFIFQIASCYFILAIPYVLAFEIDSFEFNLSMYILDIFYLADIILHFFIAVEHPITGDLIYNRKTIALNYLKGTLMIDAISVFPYYFIDKRLQVLKLIRIPRLTLILYFVRDRIREICNLFINEAQAPRVASFISNFVSLLLILVVICHFGTCLWANLGFAATSGEKTWFYNLNLSIMNADAGTANDFEIYTASLSQIIQTLTTVGYGNYTGFTAREYLVSMALEFFGIMLFVYFMQQIKYTFSQVDEVEAKQNEETEEVQTWLNRIDHLGNQWRMISNDKLLNKVSKILTANSTNNWTELFTDSAVLRMLPPAERLEVLKFSMKHITQQFSVFFRNISEVFQTELLAKAESKLFLENETIIQRGKRSPGVFFILEGNVLLALGADEVISRNLVPGSFFGEMSIAVEKCSSMTYIAHNATQCILIRKEVFKEVGKKYAAEMKNLQRLAFYRHKYFLHVKQNIERGVDEDDVDSYVNKASWVKSADLPNEMQHSPEQLKRKLAPIILPPINSGNPSFLRPTVSSPKASESPDSPISVDKSPNRAMLSPLPYPSPVMRSKVSSRLNESDVDTIVSEGEEEEGNGNDEEDDGSDHSELNNSDVFPLETLDLDFEKFDENQDLVGYFEDRIDYCQQKLKALRRQVNIAIDPLSKNMMKRIQHEINFAALAAADLKHSPSD